MTLSKALALLAIVVLAAIALQAWWTLRRLGGVGADGKGQGKGKGSKRKGWADAVASTQFADTVQRLDPSLEAGNLQAGSTAFVPTQPGADATGGGSGSAAGRVTQAARRPSPRLDPLIDALATLRLDTPVSGDFLLIHLPPNRRAGAKPFYVEGLNAESGEWEPLAAGQRYGEAQAGVQMANRSGSLNEIEYSEFVQKLQDFADAVGANPDFPDMLDVVARARELDGLSNPLDAQLNVTLRSNGVAWSVPFVQQMAARQGLVPGTVLGRMVMLSKEEGAPPVFSLLIDAQAALVDEPQESAVRECVLTLDVPQTPEAEEPFPHFYRSAHALATSLDATMVDNDGMPITLQAFSAIGHEVTQLYERMQALDLAAGSPAARRLFS